MNKQDTKEIKAKAFAIKTLMSNKNFARQIGEMFTSPVGSTKNARAKALLKSIYQSKSNFNNGDGQGAALSFPFANANPFGVNINTGNQGFSSANQGFSSANPSLNTNPAFPTMIKTVDSVLFGNNNNPFLNSSNAPTNQGLKYVLDPVSQDVFDKNGGYISEDAAAAIPNFWSQVERPTIPTGFKKPASTVVPPVVPKISIAQETVGNIASGIAKYGSLLANIFAKTGQKVAGTIGTGLVGTATTSPLLAYNTLKETASWFDPNRKTPDLVDPFKYVKIVWPFKSTGKYSGPTVDSTSAPTSATGLTLPWDDIRYYLGTTDKKYIRYAGSDLVYDKNNPTSPVAMSISSDKIEDVTLTREQATTNMKDISPITGLHKNVDPATGINKNIDPVTGDFKINPMENPNLDSTIVNNQQSALSYINDPNSDPSVAEYMKGILDAYNSGLGPTGAFNIIMEDNKKKAQLLGISEQEAALMPGASLQKYLIDMRKNMELAADLENRSARIENMILQGSNVEGDFKAYIRRKDQYLGTIEKMQSDFETQLAHMDTSNPYVAQRMENYSNYLTILHGRQNQRYIDFLNAGTKQYQTQIDQLTTIYNRDVKKVEELYRDQSALTTETYTNMKTMVSELWDNLDSREEKSQAKEKFQKEMNLTNAQIAKTIAEKNKLENGTADEVQDLSDADIKVIRGSFANFDEETKKWTLNDFNPYTAVQSAQARGKQSAEVAFGEWLNVATQQMKDSLAVGDMSIYTKLGNTIKGLTPPDGIMGMEEDAFAALTDAEKVAKYDTYSTEEKKIIDANILSVFYKDSLAGKMIEATNDSIYSALSADPSKLQEAVDNIASKGGWFSGKKSRDEFIAAYSDAFGKNIAEKIFDSLNAEIDAYMAIDKKTSRKDVVDRLLSSADGTPATAATLPGKIAALITKYMVVGNSL